MGNIKNIEARRTSDMPGKSDTNFGDIVSKKAKELYGDNFDFSSCLVEKAKDGIFTVTFENKNGFWGDSIKERKGRIWNESEKEEKQSQVKG